MIFQFPLNAEDDHLIYEEYGIVDIKCYGGNPVEINGSVWYLNPEIEEWLNENTPSYFWDSESMLIWFTHEPEAMLFKLTHL